MPLRDLQTALGSLLTAQAAGQTTVLPLGSLNLTVDERIWLTGLIDTPGFEVTCYIQRWWRETKLRWTARLTLAALGPELGATMLRRYLDVTPISSLFFTPEALGFLNFVAREAAHLPHVAQVAHFERALLIVKDAALQFVNEIVEVDQLPHNQQIAQHPAAALLELAAPSEELLGALVTGHSLPPAHAERFPILIAPGLPHLWRPAALDEARLFVACQLAATIASLRALVPDSEQTLQLLLNVGALQLVG